MRRPFLENDTYHHIILRGTRGLNIFPEISDWWHCLDCLYYQNDANRPHKWQRDLAQYKCKRFERPPHWDVRDPLVSITAYCIHHTHLHLIVRQLQDNGISDLMRRIPKNLTHRYNQRYGGTGSIFQGPYTSRFIETEHDRKNVTLYVTAKNTMERYPNGGINKSTEHFETAFAWATTDTFSSFPDYAHCRMSPIIDAAEITHLYPTTHAFKKDCRDYISAYQKRNTT